jgi:hypothetical protein
MAKNYKIREEKTQYNRTCFCGKKLQKGETVYYVLHKISSRCKDCVEKYIAILNRVLNKSKKLTGKGGKAGSFHGKDGRVIRGTNNS